MREKIINYVKKKYKAEPEYMWSKYKDYFIFRHSDNGKWFALVMRVAREKLGLSGGETDVINLKIDDMFLKEILFREEGIMPSYHMNKMHWITVLLDGTVPEEQVLDLIDQSFMATASKKKKDEYRPAKEWIIPANPKYYDIVHAFDEADEIIWKQGAGIKKGDTVFVYAAAPVSAILYKCKVTETDIPFDYSGEINIKAVMNIKLKKRYEPGQFTFKVLNDEYGIRTVRGPRGIPNSLSKALE